MAGLPARFRRRSGTKGQRPDLSPCDLRRKLRLRFVIPDLRSVDSFTPAHVALRVPHPRDLPRAPPRSGDVTFCSNLRAPRSLVAAETLRESQSLQTSATDERRYQKMVSRGVPPAGNNSVLRTGLPRALRRQAAPPLNSSCLHDAERPADRRLPLRPRPKFPAHRPAARTNPRLRSKSGP
jgi:hypothetical protein